MELYDEKSQRMSNALKTVNIILVVIIIILALILLSMTFLWTPMTVKGPSMKETLHQDDHFVLQTCWYSYTYGDIIVFKKMGVDTNVIKRVIGLPGDHVRFSVEEGAWYRNGEKLIEDYVTCSYPSNYITHQTPPEICSEEGYLIEEGKVFVLGDNRAESNDSHIYGSIDQEQIKGKFLFRY